jgi:hypothetical protein
VQILRHPCGYVNSVLRGESARRFTHGVAAEDFGLFAELCRQQPALRRGITLAHIREMPPAKRLAWRWVIFNEHALAQAAPTDRNLVLYYEELCSSPESVTQRLFAFCGLPWDSQTADFLRSSTGEQRDDYYSVIKNPLDSAWKWRTQLDPVSAQHVLDVMRQSEIAEPYFGHNGWACAGEVAEATPCDGSQPTGGTPA